MAITESDLARAEKRMASRRASIPTISRAHYNRRYRVVELLFNNGMTVRMPPDKIQGLERARPADLNDIEIDAAGLSLHWPKLDVDLYLPALLQGVTGSAAWMAAQLGAKGGAVTSDAKQAAARRNGRLGGRPRKPGVAA